MTRVLHFEITSSGHKPNMMLLHQDCVVGHFDVLIKKQTMIVQREKNPYSKPVEEDTVGVLVTPVVVSDVETTNFYTHWNNIPS